MRYPVRFDATPPERYDRVHVVLRFLIGLLISWTVARVLPVGLFTLLYLALPVIAAVSIDDRGAAGYQTTVGARITGLLRWILSFWAYMVFSTDRFPTRRDSLVDLEITPTGAPTVGSALLRLIYGIPEALVLVILGFIGAFVWIIQAIAVLLTRKCPHPLVAYQRGVLRWAARLLAYQASLVAPYPPFALNTGHEPPPATGEQASS